MEKDLIQNPHDIRLNEQNQIQAILGRPPGWILQWGITFVALCVIALLVVGWIVRYPDIIEARVKLITENPPLHLVVQTSGKLTSLLVKDKQEVSSDRLLAVIENSANYNDVLRLEKLLAELEDDPKTKIPTNFKLGELQNGFSNFLQNRKDFVFFKGKKEVKKKVRALKSQIRYLGRKNRNIELRKISIQEELDLAIDNRDRMTNLVAEGLESQQKKEAAQTVVIQTQRKFDNTQSEILDNKMKIKELEVQIIDLESGREDDDNSKQLELDDNIFTLQGKIDEWKQKYLIYSPIEGIISFPKKINRLQFVKEGEELMTILPNDGIGDIVGNALLSSDGFGKVTDTSVVYIRLDAYPYKEYGSIKTSVKSLPSTPQDDGMYLIDLNIESEIFNNQIISTSNDTIPFRQELEGTARVITKDRRILERIFDELMGWSEK